MLPFPKMSSIQTWQALGQLGLSVIAPLAAVTAVLDFAGLPLLAAIALTLLASPGLFLVAKAWTRASNRRRAAALGAELPPTVHDDSLFKTGATNTMLKNMSSGQLGASRLSLLLVHMLTNLRIAPLRMEGTVWPDLHAGDYLDR